MLQNTLFASLICLLLSPVHAYKEERRFKSPSVANSQITSVPRNGELWLLIEKNPNAVVFTTMIRPIQRIQLTLTGKLNSTTEAYKLTSLRVKFSDGRMQTISLRGNPVTWSKNETYPFLKLADFNFDGYADLQVFDNAGATGNFWYQSWFYKQKSFVYSRSLSETPSPRIDSKQKQILSYFRSGACQETVGYYKIKKNSLFPIRYVYSEESRCDSQPCCVVYKKELSGKKWETVKLSSGDIYEDYYNR